MSWRRVRALGWLVFGAAHGLLLAAEFLTAQDPRSQRRDLALAPPTLPRWVDEQGDFHLRPFIYPWRASGVEPGRYVEDFSRPLPLQFFVAAEGNRLWGWLPCPLRLVDTVPAGELHLLGTDALGRDLWARLLSGGRLSLSTALVATLLALALGAVGGVVAGYSDGWGGSLLAWTAQLFLAVPWLYLLLAVRGTLPLEMPAGVAWLLFSGMLGVAGWGRVGLLVRAAIAGVRRQSFVEAAVGMGLHPWQVLWRHVLPSVHGLLGTQAALLVPRFVVAEVTLSLLGVGISEPQPSWGNLLSVLIHSDEGLRHPWLLTPACALVVLVLGYQALADRLKDPHLKV